MDGIQRELGRQGAEISALQIDMTEAKGDIKKVLAILNQAQGGWKLMLLVGGVAGAMGAFVRKILIAIGGTVK